MHKRKTHDPLASLLQFEHGAKISHECQPEIFLGNRDLGQSLRRVQKGFFCPSAEEPCSAEEGERFELNIFLVGTTCKCSV